MRVELVKSNNYPILCDLEDIRSIIAEEELGFVLRILSSLTSESKINDCIPGEHLSELKAKINLRNLCDELGVVIRQENNGLKILVKKDKNLLVRIGQFFEPEIIRKIDPEKNKIFAEIYLSTYSIYDESELE